MIEINNLTKIAVDQDFLKKIIKQVLKQEEKPIAPLSLALVGPTRIRKLNQEYRGRETEPGVYGLLC